MKKTLPILTIIALIGCIGIARFAYAQTSVDLTEKELKMIEGMRSKKEAKKAKMIEELGLTEEQQQKLEDHKNTHKSQMNEQREAKKDLHAQLKAEIEKVELDTGTIYSIHEQIKALDIEMADHRLEGMLQIREILTPEQFKIFHEKFGKKKEKGHGDRPKGGKGGF